MESYKHSCPFCGQHIEYTVGYCGQQMQCPMCGQTVTFPAIPPGRAGQSLRVKGTEVKAARKMEFKLPKALVFLREFQHWNVVGQIAVPFVAIGVLWWGANFVKNKFGTSSSDNASAPVVQADPDAWQRMTALTKSEQDVQAAAKELEHENDALEYAQHSRKSVNNGDPYQQKAADERVARAQITLKIARQRFDAANAKYRQLGGTKDYRSLLRKY